MHCLKTKLDLNKSRKYKNLFFKIHAIYSFFKRSSLMHFSKLLLIIATLLFLTSCSWFSFSSNVDPKNFKEYYKSSLITQYSKKEATSLPSYEDLGLVEGLDCQVSEEYPTPKEAIAKKIMLENAADLGANAVILGKCVKIENTLTCISEYTCYGQAIKLKDQDRD